MIRFLTISGKWVVHIAKEYLIMKKINPLTYFRKY